MIIARPFEEWVSEGNYRYAITLAKAISFNFMPALPASDMSVKKECHVKFAGLLWVLLRLLRERVHPLSDL